MSMKQDDVGKHAVATDHASGRSVYIGEVTHTLPEWSVFGSEAEAVEFVRICDVRHSRERKRYIADLNYMSRTK